jgi:GTP-dependent phosphoenolpyruvate carboxykinase
MRHTTAILCVLAITGVLGGCASNATNHSRVMNMLNEFQPMANYDANDATTGGSTTTDELLEKLREHQSSAKLERYTQDLTLTFEPKQQRASDIQREQIAAWLDSTTSSAAGIRVDIGPPGRVSSNLQALVIAQHRGHSVAQFLHSVTERVNVRFEPKLRRDTMTIKPL